MSAVLHRQRHRAGAGPAYSTTTCSCGHVKAAADGRQ
nr:MAG TPA: hypothetical protein [Bacteriophage sp.]